MGTASKDDLRGQDLIDLTQDSPPPRLIDSEDEDLKTAIALSLQESDALTDNSIQSSTSSQGYGIPGINRRQQEEERLARLKRKRNEDVSPSVWRHLRGSSSERVTSERVHTTSTAQASPIQGPDVKIDGRGTSLPYEDGSTLKTWAYGFLRQQDVKIEEVLEKNTLQSAVFSSFQWDMEWLFQKLDTKRTKFVLVMQAKEQGVKEQYRREIALMPNLRLCFPPMEGLVNCMHSKLMLLFHPTHMRIAVPTANLVPYDWGEQGGFMENSVWLIDLPLLEKESAGLATDFKIELETFLKAQNMQQDVLEKMQLFDFSKTEKYAFIHSVGGSHFEPDLHHTGICGLARAVNMLHLNSKNPVQIDYITSSVGSLNGEFLQSMYAAAKGHDGLKVQRVQRGKSIASQDMQVDQNRDDWRKNFRCYFPSEGAIKESKAGPNGAGTLCFQEKWWKSPTFPQEIMRECCSVRPGMLMHNKIMYVRPNAVADQAASSSWAYVGSANLSESAW